MYGMVRKMAFFTKYYIVHLLSYEFDFQNTRIIKILVQKNVLERNFTKVF